MKLAFASLALAVTAILAAARVEAAVPVQPASAYEQYHGPAEAQASRSFDLLPSLPPVPSGKVKTYYLFAEVKPWEVAPGIVTPAWTYNGTVPGPTIHVRQGDRVRVVLINELPAPTTIHFHGLPVDPDMDGVPGMSQNAV